jgi:hypothetical protein
MSLFGWDLPAGCSLRAIDALCEEETPLAAYATDHYREAMIGRLAHTLDDAVCVQIAASELASHGYPNAAPWAVRDWLDAFGCEMALRHVTELME